MPCSGSCPPAARPAPLGQAPASCPAPPRLPFALPHPALHPSPPCLMPFFFRWVLPPRPAAWHARLSPFTSLLSLPLSPLFVPHHLLPPSVPSPVPRLSTCFRLSDDPGVTVTLTVHLVSKPPCSDSARTPASSVTCTCACAEERSGHRESNLAQGNLKIQLSLAAEG